MIEADHADRRGQIAGKAQGGDDVGGSAEADIPEDEFAGVPGPPFAQAELADVKGFGFLGGSAGRVHGFALGEGMDGARAIGEPNELIRERGGHADSRRRQMARGGKPGVAP